MKYIIYGLTDPDTQEVRYIGKSTSGMKRPMEHKKPCNLKVPSHKVNWIKQLISLNKQYGVIILESLDIPENLDAREIYWIAEYKNRGVILTNSTDGGEGSLGREVKDNTREILSIKRKEFHENNPEIAKELGLSQRKQHEFIEGVEHKHCSDCKLTKPLIDFSEKITGWDGHHTICKTCAATRTAKYRELNHTELLSEEEWYQSYQDRKEAMSKGAKAAYINDPELKNRISKARSKAIIGIPSEAGLKPVEFDSALIAYKEAGFNNTYISQAIKSGKPYKGYFWKFK